MTATVYDLPERLRVRQSPCRGKGGAGLVGRQYLLHGRVVTVLVAYGPGASVRNVWLRYADDGSETIRPFRGLRVPPEQLAAR